MIEKITFGKLREDIEKNKGLAVEYETEEGDWGYHDSSLFEIGSSFNKTLPKEYIGKITDIREAGLAFEKYIIETLSKNQNKERTAIEFGGPGSKFFNDFKKGFLGKTVGVCLDDIRHSDEIEKDKSINHSVIVGDIMNITNKSLYEKLNECLKTEKVDLIISRMMGPLDKLKKNPVLLDHIIRKWYSLLNNGGILFAQFEYFSEHDPNMKTRYDAENFPEKEKEIEKYVKEWVLAINNKFPNQIEIQLGRGVIRLVKKEGAPEELPSSKELFDI